MKTKSTGRVALRDEEITAVRREVEAESENRHRLTDIEAFGLAESVKTWQYHGPDPRNTSLIGSYVGSVKIDDVEVTVRLMKDRYVNEFCDVGYVYTMTAATKDLIISDRSYGIRPMVKKLYEHLDSEHNALLKELRTNIDSNMNTDRIRYQSKIKSYLNEDKKQ